MKPPIVEAFENKIKKEAEREFYKKNRVTIPIDEIMGYAFCIFAIVWIGKWAIVLVIAELIYLSYLKTIARKVEEDKRTEAKVEDVEE